MKVAPVTGTITLDGAPLANASVRFQPVAGGRPGSGFTDENGKYVLDYSMREAGAEVGKNEVHISTGGQEGDYGADGQMAGGTSKNRVPAKYRTEPPIVDVESKRNVIDIDLKSGG